MRIALLQLDSSGVPRREPRPRPGPARGSRRPRREAGVLPEMFATGFSLDMPKVAQPQGGPTETFLAETADRLGCTSLPASPWPPNRFPRTTPSSPRRWDDPPVREDPPVLVRRRGEVRLPGRLRRDLRRRGRAAHPLVCYDLRFPEPFRLAADDTDLYCVIANWPERRRAHWRTLLQARAIENLAYVAASTASARGGVPYQGDSALISPWGRRCSTPRRRRRSSSAT